LSVLQTNLDGTAMAPEKPSYFLLQIRKFISIPENQENLYYPTMIMTSLVLALMMITKTMPLGLLPILTEDNIRILIQKELLDSKLEKMLRA
jgi:hypothetical protein